MGSPGFWWYDRGARTFTTVGLPNLTLCHREPFRDVVDAEGWQLARHDRGGGQLIRLGCRLNTQAHMADIRKLMTLDTHLRGGGKVAFAGDDGQVFAAPTVRPAYSGDTELIVATSVLPWGTSTLSAGHELLLQTLSPYHLERSVLSADQTAIGSNVKLTLSAPLVRDLPQGSMVRQFRTFPTLFMDASTSTSPARWLSDARYPGRIYEMDLTLVELPYEVAALADAVLASGARRLDMGGLTLESQVFRGLRERPRGLDVQAAADAGLAGGWR